MKLFWLLSLLLILNLDLAAQQNTRESGYSLLYELAAGEVLEYFQTGNETQLLDKVLAREPLDSSKLGVGQSELLPQREGSYLVLWGDAPRLSFKLLFQHPFGMTSILKGNKTLLYLYNRYTYEPVTDAQIHTKKGVVHYDEKAGGYLVKNRHNEEILVQQGNDLWLTGINKYESYGPGFWESLIDKVTFWVEKILDPKPGYYGYAALNKPQFRVGDTLHYKVFVLNKKGKAADREDVYLEMSYYDAARAKNKTQLLTSFTEKRKGSFTGSFAVPDSLDGKRVSLRVKSSRYDHNLFTASFSVEDYTVDEIVFTSEVLNPNEEFAPNLPLKLSLSAFTHSRLPVMDARVRIKLIPTQHLHYSTEDVVIIPPVLLDTTFFLDPSGEQQFSFTPVGFPPVQSIRAEVELWNSANEYHREFHYLNFRPQPPLLTTEDTPEGTWLLAADSANAGLELQIEAWQKATYSRARDFRHPDSLLQVKEISLPHFEKANPAVDYLKVYDGDTLVEQIDIQADTRVPDRWVHEGRVYLVFYGATKEPVYYEVLKNGRKRWKQEVAYRDTVSFPVPGADYLTVRYAILNREESSARHFPIVLNPDMVKVPITRLSGNVEGPGRVYPGDSAQWKIKIEDKKQRPYAGFELLAMSRKKGFERESLTEMFPPWRYDESLYRPFRYNTRIDQNPVKEKAPLLQKAYEKLNLRKQDAFRYYFREEGLITDTFRVSENKEFGEFAAFVYDSIAPQPVYAIYANGVPVFGYHWHNPTYSFPLQPGRYNISIRCRDFELQVPDVEIFANTKTEVALNLQKLPQKVKRQEKPPHFTKEEFCELADYSLYFKTPQRQVFYFEQGHKWLQVRGGRVQLAGPFEKGQARYWDPSMDTISFYFEPGQSYRFHRNVVYTSPVEEMYRPSRFPFIKNQQPGERLPEKINIYQRGREFPSVHQNVPDLRGIPTGLLHLHNGTDSLFIYYQLYQYENDTLYYGRSAFNGRKKWPEGTYRLQAFAAGFSAIVVDSVSVKKDHVTHVFLHPRQWVQISADSAEGLTPQVMQPNSGRSQLQGQVSDAATGESIPFANVEVRDLSGRLITGTSTDFDGKFEFAGLAAGRYRVEVSFIGRSMVSNLVEVRKGKRSSLVVSLPESSNELQEVQVMYSAPRINKTKGAKVTTSGDIANMAVRDVTSISAQAAGLRGARDDGSVYFIDGVKVRGVANLPQAAIAQTEVIAGGLPAEYGDAIGGVLDQGQTGIKSAADSSLAALTAKGGGTRETFSDYAFFIPDVTTDENGEAVVKMQFPGDVTTWETTILGMDEGFKYFKHKALTSAFSEVTATLAVPSYLREGDSCVVVGQTINYLDTVLQVHNRFSVNGKDLMDSSRSVSSNLVDKLPILATDGSLWLEYSMQLEGGFRDGEKRQVPVQKPGISIAEGEFFKTDGDTSITIQNPGSSEYLFSLMNGSEAVLLQLTEELAAYRYECNEQLASRLKALLAQKTILEKRGEKFRHNLEVKRIIDKLEKARNDYSAWGWWPGQPTDVFMSLYVMEALQRAIGHGYKVASLVPSEQWMAELMFQRKPQERIDILYYFNRSGKKDAYEYFTRDVEWDSLSTSEKLKLAIIFEDQGIDYEREKVDTLISTDIFGNLYAPEDGRFALMGKMSNSLLLAEWLKLRGQKDNLAAVKDHLLMSASLSQLNTIEKAAAIRLLMEHEQGSPAAVHYNLNGKEGALEPGKPLQMRDTAQEVNLRLETTAPVYVSISKRIADPAPAKKDEHFDIKASWKNKKGEHVDSLQNGEWYTLEVDVDAARQADYVMIKIPKPAGTVYQAEYLFGPNHYMENKQDHLNLYIKRMREGENRFQVKLMPRFSGRFRWDPAQVELMYFPVFNGNDAARDVVVK